VATVARAIRSVRRRRALICGRAEEEDVMVR
jgi:hypothetical protein